MKPAIWIAAGLAVAGLAAPQRALASSGVRKDVTAAPMAYVEQFVPANVGYTIETRNLAPSTADTVIHVQDRNDANGRFVAGNDDSGGLASKVVIAPAPSDRVLQIIVRAYGAGSGGTGELVRTATTGAVTVNSIAFGGVSPVVVSDGIQASGHVFTVEQQGGTNDTLLLVVSGSAANAIAFDDDDGIETMSWLHLDTACAAGCQLFAGSRLAGAAAAPTTVIWDEGAHAATACDGDAISDSLERAIGTDPCLNDTDGDGLPDGAELMGVVEGDASHPAVKLPYYGADPLKKDVFVELDWVGCTVANHNCSDDTRPDVFQPPADVALGAASFYAPDVAVHFDTGVANTDPATRTTFGAWGGATRIADGTGYCQTLTPSRVGLFHHGIIAGNNGGGQADSINGYCFTAGNSSRGRAVAHELGHGFGLAHGGQPSNDVNCKPHYRSIMNYSYLYDSSVTQFSRGQFSSVQLNPAAMDETAGLGTTDLGRIAFLATPPWNFAVASTGAVDWNRDGVISPAGTLVGAAPSWAPGSCEQSAVGRFDLHLGYGPTAAWLRPASGAARHYVINRVPGGGDLQARFTTNLASCRQNPAFPCASWSPALGSPPATWPVHRGGSNAPIATRLGFPDGSDRLAVVYSDAASHLVLDLLRVDASGAESVVSTTVGTGTDVVQGDAAVVAFNGKLLVFGMVAGQVKRWDYDPATGLFSAPVVQLYSTGLPVTVGQAMAVTTGYQSDNPAQQLYAIFPTGASPSTLVMARFDATTARWVQFPSSIFASGAFRTSVRPGLAFVPFSPATPKVGRFFLIWQDGDMRTSMTQGNDVTPGATSRQLGWLFQLDFYNVWAVAQSGVGMAFDPVFDTNPRATWTHVNGYANVGPLADGIYNVQLRDFDDYATVLRNLACSLTRSCR